MNSIYTGPPTHPITGPPTPTQLRAYLKLTSHYGADPLRKRPCDPFARLYQAHGVHSLMAHVEKIT